MKKLYLLLGPSGVGKTKQAELLSKVIGADVFSLSRILNPSNPSVDLNYWSLFKKFLAGNSSSSIILDDLPFLEVEIQNLIRFCKENEIQIEAIIQINIALDKLLNRSNADLKEKFINEYSNYLNVNPTVKDFIRLNSKMFFYCQWR
jgi:adenylate kinase family enzyme